MELVLHLLLQMFVVFRQANNVTMTGPGGAVPVCLDGQLGAALLDAVVQQFGLGNRMVQV